MLYFQMRFCFEAAPLNLSLFSKLVSCCSRIWRQLSPWQLILLLIGSNDFYSETQALTCSHGCFLCSLFWALQIHRKPNTAFKHMLHPLTYKCDLCLAYTVLSNYRSTKMFIIMPLLIMRSASNLFICQILVFVFISHTV